MGISKIEVITGMSKLTNLISELSKVGVRGVTVMQVQIGRASCRERV